MPPSSRYESADWYDTPHYYDIIFDKGTTQEATFLEAVFARHSQVAKQARKLSVLEPACGSGRLMAELSRRGHSVAGFDLNPQMLKAARKRLESCGGRATLKKQRLEEFSLAGRFDLAHCLLSTFKYIASEQGAVSHLQAVSDHLKTGGLYILGIHLTDYARSTPEHERWTGKKDGIDVVCNTRTFPADRQQRLERLRNRLRVTGDGQEVNLETNWECRTYDASQLLRTIRKVPDLTPVAYYDFHYDLGSPRAPKSLSDDVIVVLVKA